MSVSERLWAKVDKSGDCWIWTGYTKPTGYGLIRDETGTARTHRVAWRLAYGEIPVGLSVLHSCDNPPCVRPDHLFLGTQAENQADMTAKGRSARGERIGKLTTEQVVELRQRRALGEGVESLAAAFGLAKSVVGRIARGEARRYEPGPRVARMPHGGHRRLSQGSRGVAVPI